MEVSTSTTVQLKILSKLTKKKKCNQVLNKRHLSLPISIQNTTVLTITRIWYC